MTVVPPSSKRFQISLRLLCAAAFGLVPVSVSAQTFPFALREQQYDLLVVLVEHAGEIVPRNRY
jgi:hypothetical protein